MTANMSPGPAPASCPLPRASLGMLGWEKDVEMLQSNIFWENTGIAPSLLQEDVRQHMKEINNN